jgi:hypothetical protein
VIRQRKTRWVRFSRDKEARKELFEVDYIFAILRRFYHGLDPKYLTLGEVISLIEQITRIAKAEQGGDEKTKPMDTDTYVAAVLAGEIKPDLGGKPKPVRELTAEEKRELAKAFSVKTF